MHSGNLTAKCQNKSRFALLKVLEDKQRYIRSLHLVQTGYLLQQKNSLLNYFQPSIPHVKRLLWCPVTYLSAEEGAKMNRSHQKS